MVLIFKHGSLEEWDRSDLVLVKNEIGRVAETGQFKVGDGVSKWSELPFSETLPEAITVCWRFQAAGFSGPTMTNQRA